MDLLKSPPRRLLFALALRTAGWFLLALTVGVLFCSSARAQSDQPSEYEVKAAFLFNFTKFVEWPDGSFDDSLSPIVIGIIGDDPFGDGLVSTVAGQKVQGRSIVIRKQRFGEDLRHCHVLFISASERQRSAQILAGLHEASVLTVSDIDGFADAGGAMQFVMQENRVHFVVNLDATTQSKLRVSAKLLALARVINHGQAAR
jgi:YfiR/HmsC-like